MARKSRFGVPAGEQVSLHAANTQAAQVSRALSERDRAAADAAAEAVARALKGTDREVKLTVKPRRKREED